MMNFSIEAHIPTHFNDNARVWIFQSSRLFNMSEAFEIERILNEHCNGWKSHGKEVNGYANLFFGQFIVVMADETEATVGGCSTDSLFRTIKQIETLCKVNLFDRQMLAFLVNDKVQLLPLAQIKYAVSNNLISTSTLYFNNTLGTKKELIGSWMIPISESWLSARV
jgi:hypothetical protein